MSEVVFENVHKVYHPEKGPDAHAVRGVTLEIRRGELMVLVGPSGCGKSTLLRMIAGLEQVTSGTIRIGEQVVNEVAPKDRDVSMVFQNYALFPHMTVRENLAFALKFRNVAKAEVVERVAEAAKLLHIEDVLDRKPKALSGGQRQRTALGRALVRRPKVFLLDEPLSNLDARMRAEMRAEIAKLHSRLRTTMIFVTHDQTEAMTLGERLCVMRDGLIMQLGTPLEVYQRPQKLFVAAFIGSPGMNLLPGTITADHGRLAFRDQARETGGLDLALTGARFQKIQSLAGAAVILGLRSEDIDVYETAGAPPGRSLTTARVEVYEPMGHETLLHLSLGSHTVIARAASTKQFSIGQTVAVECRLDRAILFDAKTQEAIDAGET